MQTHLGATSCGKCPPFGVREWGYIHREIPVNFGLCLVAQ